MSDYEDLAEGDFAYVYINTEYLPVAWLVYRGTLNSCEITSANPGNLSLFLMNVVQRGMHSTLRREGSLEGYRMKDYACHVSRLKCVYAWPTLEAAYRGADGIGHFQRHNLVAIAPVDNDFRREEHDSIWIDDFDSLPANTAKRYWEGELTKSPLMECLLEGRFNILGTKVREKAYATIKRTAPKSLAMLELSRLAAVFGSDLGSSSPWIEVDGNKLIASFVISYNEAEGLDVFAKAIVEKQRNPEFQINLADIEPLTKQEPKEELDDLFRVPDLQPYMNSFRVDKFQDLNNFARIVLTVGMVT